jgi:acetylglutamate kinase
MKLTVIKYGGSLLEDAAHQETFLKDVAALAKREKILIVHGGGKEITKAMEAAGLVATFVGGRRYTDEKTMAVVEETLAGVNARIVAILKTHGVAAARFSGRSENLMTARTLEDLGRVGEPSEVRADTLREIVARTELPVFYSVAQDSSGAPLNINADDFALALAAAVSAEKLVYLTDTGGILDKAGKRLERLTPDAVERLIDDETITGGMAVKARACVQALQQGVGQVDIAKGIGLSSAETERTSFVNNSYEHR